MSDQVDSLETALRQLTPLPATLDRDRLLFRAGKASGRRARWRLALLTALLGAGSGIAGSYLGMPRTPEAPPQVVVIHVPIPVAPARDEVTKQSEPAIPTTVPATSIDSHQFFPLASPSGGYLHLRDQALRWGVDSLPMAVPSSLSGPLPGPNNMQKMQSEWLGKASDS